MIDLTQDRLNDMRAWARWEGFPHFPIPNENGEGPDILFTPGMPTGLMYGWALEVLADVGDAGFRKILQLAGEIVQQNQGALDDARRQMDSPSSWPAMWLAGPYRVSKFCFERTPVAGYPASKVFASLALWALEVHKSYLLTHNDKEAEFAFRNAALFLMDAHREHGKELTQQLAVERRSTAALKGADKRYEKKRKQMQEIEAFYRTRTWKPQTRAVKAIRNKFDPPVEDGTIDEWCTQWKRAGKKPI